jgi:hypothetical protein
MRIRIRNTTILLNLRKVTHKILSLILYNGHTDDKKPHSGTEYVKAHLRIVRRRHAVQVARDLGPQIGNHDKFLQHVLGQDVGVARLLDVVAAHVDVVGAEVEVGGADGSHPPLCLAGECVALVVAGGAGDDLVTVLVHRSCGGGGELGNKGVI